MVARAAGAGHRRRGPAPRPAPRRSPAPRPTRVRPRPPAWNRLLHTACTVSVREGPLPPGACAQRARAVVLFGEVDEGEVARERMRPLPRALERPPGHDHFGLPFVLVAVAPPDHGPPQRFAVLEQTRSAVILDHP